MRAIFGVSGVENARFITKVDEFRVAVSDLDQVLEVSGSNDFGVGLFVWCCFSRIFEKGGGIVKNFRPEIFSRLIISKTDYCQILY